MNTGTPTNDDIAAYVDRVITDKQQPVVLFALEWCEFCWSLRKLLEKCSIPYRSVDLDSVENQKNNRGRAIRNVLKQRTGFETIPQLFVGGHFIGGCTETLDAFTAGKLQQMLHDCHVTYQQPQDLDPYSLLPKWLQPR